MASGGSIPLIFRTAQAADATPSLTASLNTTGELPVRKPLVQRSRAAKEEALRGTVYRIKKNAADNLRKEKKKREETFGLDASRGDEGLIAVNATRIRQNMGTPPVQNLSHSEHLVSGTNGAISLQGGKQTIDIHIGNVNTYNIYVHPDAKTLNLSAPPETELRKAANSRVLRANPPNLIASGKAVSQSGMSSTLPSKRPGKQTPDSTFGGPSTQYQGFGVQQQAMNNTAGSFKIGKVKRNNFLSQGGKDSGVEKRNGSPSHTPLPPTPPLPTVAVGQGSVLSKYRMYQTGGAAPPKKRAQAPTQTDQDKPPSMGTTLSGGYRSTNKPSAQIHMLSGVSLKAL